MSTILVAAALRDRAAHDEALAYMRANAKPGVQVVASLDPPEMGGVDWDAVRAAEGGWDGLGPWAARTYGMICAVPVNGMTGLSRIVYAMCDAALAAGRPVVLYRPDIRGLRHVARVAISDEHEFKGVYGVAILHPRARQEAT